MAQLDKWLREIETITSDVSTALNASLGPISSICQYGELVLKSKNTVKHSEI